MEYFQIRLTPLVMDPSMNPRDCIQVFFLLIKTYSLTEYALCYEKLNKYLEPTHPHFHFNFACFKNKETVRMQFLRICENELGRRPKGNTQYSIAGIKEPDDIQRWWRYIFKEKPILKYCKSFTDTEIKQMTLIASDERKRAALHWHQKRETKDEKSTIFQRYSLLIKKQNLVYSFKTYG